MRKIYFILLLIFLVSDSFGQMAGTLTVQYVPRIREQSIGFIYRTSERVGYHLNVGRITGYNFFYMRSNDTTYSFLTSRGNGVALRMALRYVYPVKNSSAEFYAEPLLVFKHYSFKDTAYSNQKNLNDTAFFNAYNYYPQQLDGVQKYRRNGVQLGMLIGWHFYFNENITASINTGFSLRWQQYNLSGRPYPYSFSNYGASFHLNFGIGYVFLKPTMAGPRE
jgi:hypothetical protein